MVQPAPVFFPAMAMTTPTKNRRTSLTRRIRLFYKLLNSRAFQRCYQMIDPRVRLKPRSVTLFQYESSLREFLQHVGSVTILETHVELHLEESSVLYEGRDFAIGQTIWE